MNRKPDGQCLCRRDIGYRSRLKFLRRARFTSIATPHARNEAEAMSYSAAPSLTIGKAFPRDVTRQCIWKIHRRESRTARERKKPLRARTRAILVAPAVVALYYAGAAE